MVNNSKLKLIYLMILFGLSIAQLFLYDASPTESKILQIQRTRLAMIMKKTANHKKPLLAKTRTARRSCQVKKGRTNAWWKNFITNEVPESEWKDNFRMLRKSFYEFSDMLRSYLEKKRTRPSKSTSVEA